MLPPARIAIAGCIERARYPPVLRTLDYRVGAVVGGDLARNAHQESAEILPAQEPDEGPRRVLESLNHNLAIFDSSLADPGRDIAHEIPDLSSEIRHWPTSAKGSLFPRPVRRSRSRE